MLYMFRAYSMPIIRSPSTALTTSGVDKTAMDIIVVLVYKILKILKWYKID
jgi:hypothetical protein